MREGRDDVVETELGENAEGSEDAVDEGAEAESVDASAVAISIPASPVSTDCFFAWAFFHVMFSKRLTSMSAQSSGGGSLWGTTCSSQCTRSIFWSCLVLRLKATTYVDGKARRRIDNESVTPHEQGKGQVEDGDEDDCSLVTLVSCSVAVPESPDARLTSLRIASLCIRLSLNHRNAEPGDVDVIRVGENGPDNKDSQLCVPGMSSLSSLPGILTPISLTLRTNQLSTSVVRFACSSLMRATLSLKPVNRFLGGRTGSMGAASIFEQSVTVQQHSRDGGKRWGKTRECGSGARGVAS